MRARIGLLILAVATTLLAPISQKAFAFSGYASAPLSVTATAIAGGVRVGWSAPTDVDTGVTGYRVEYSTSGTSGSWTLSTTTSSSTYSYDIPGLSQVATYVRVAATTAAGTGTYGYPWTKIYGTTSLQRDSSGYVIYEAGYGVGGSDPYTTKSSAAFSRIRYRLDATISSVAYYAEADAYEWPTGTNTDSRGGYDPTVSSLMIPSNNSPYTYFVQANVSDLNVYSNNSNVTKGKGLSGRLEIWPRNYATAVNGLSPSGNGSNYDYDDTWDVSGAYGSFQIHDMTNYKPVFAWNRSEYGATAEVGFGANTGTHPDWTFCADGGVRGSCPLPSYFRIQIFINEPVTPLADATPPTVTRIDAKSLIKNGDTISVQSNEQGTVYLVRNSISVTNAASIAGAAANTKSSVSISSAGVTTTLTTSGLLDGTYNLYAVDLLNNVSSAIVSTVRLDSTAPTVSTYAVNAAGTAITLTMGETVTLASFASGAYTLSDSGSVLSVSSASVSGLVVTLNLSRSIPANAYVTFAYAPSLVGATGRWIDAAGNELAAISLRNITNNSTTPISVSLTVPEPVSKGSSITITAIVSVAGKVTFLIAGKRIPGCLNKTASGTTPITVTCTMKTALSSFQTFKAILIPTLGSYPTTSAQVERFITKRTNTR